MKRRNQFYTIWMKRPIDEEPVLLEEYPCDLSKRQAINIAKSLLPDVNPKTIIYVRKITIGSYDCKQFEFKNEKEQDSN